MSKKALVVGGANGIGLALSLKLASRGYDKVYIIDKTKPMQFNYDNIEFTEFNLLSKDYSIFDNFYDIDTLIISAGFGRVAPFESIKEQEIVNSFSVNAESIIRIINRFYKKLIAKESFDCAVMGSISGFVSSPLFAVYGATKAAVCSFIESINIELEMNRTSNRILNVSPGSIQGTSFSGGKNNLTQLDKLSEEILDNMMKKNSLFIPDYDSIFEGVLNRYHADKHKFGVESYLYKKEHNRVNFKPQLKVGYLSGTFDLFHIGHLNLLIKAKKYCDYLIVGLHKNGAYNNKEVFIPFEERKAILENIIHVDRVIEAPTEDHEAFDLFDYDYLFVGSDYKGSERFLRYEAYFKDKKAEIIYFDYTAGTSSTKLRTAIDLSTNK